LSRPSALTSEEALGTGGGNINGGNGKPAGGPCPPGKGNGGIFPGWAESGIGGNGGIIGAAAASKTAIFLCPPYSSLTCFCFAQYCLHVISVKP